MSERLTGTVKSYESHRRFGFVTPDNGGTDIFFSANSCVQFDPIRGDRVSFVVGTNRAGPAAKDIRIVSYGD
jgi:cold shock CspA family protein